MPITHSTYGFGTSVPLPFERAVERVTALLRDEGFGVLTTIDVQSTLKQKLDVDFRRYVILGACNPPLAYRAFQAELQVGLLLPCNVIVYESGADASEVALMDPEAALGLAAGDALRAVASEVRAKLMKVAERLAG